MNQRPPFLLHLLGTGFVLVSLVHFLGVIQVVQSWNWLRVIDYRPDPIYTVFKSGFLALAFLTSAIFLWIRFSWAPLFNGIVILLAVIWFWVDRIFLSQNPMPLKDHLFSLLATVLILFFSLFSLYLLQPYMKENPLTIHEEAESGDQND